MYKVVIDIRKDISQDILKTLAGVADKAFDNRAGKVKNTSDMLYRFIYRGAIGNMVVLKLVCLILKDNRTFCSI